MPNTSSAKKRVRQTEVRTLRNKDKRSAMRTAVRRVREAVAAGNKSEATEALRDAYKAIDKCAKHNILHDNTAANHKARLTRNVNQM